MPELADIFNKFGDKYREKHKLPVYILKAINAIKNCRTEALGGRKYGCNDCGNEFSLYNSCRNRHCPKCQIAVREKWLKEREKNLLPVGYFHVVLTVPHDLNEIFQWNKKIMYGILFSSASETLLELGADPKHLGAEIGIISILHTWGQNLNDHYHLHCVIPGGGLSKDGKRWLDSKRKDFFIPVQIISSLFKKKFMLKFQIAVSKGEIVFGGNIEYLKEHRNYLDFKDKLYKKIWIVNSKPPFGGAEHVMAYLGRYTHRVAISNSRILEVSNGNVIFKWKDYSDNSKTKIMKLNAEEFIRRFLLHILPEGFVKIRYFGILSNRNLKSKLKKCQELLKRRVSTHKKKSKSSEEKEYEEVKSCPCCKSTNLQPIQTIYPLMKNGP